MRKRFGTALIVFVLLDVLLFMNGVATANVANLQSQVTKIRRQIYDATTARDLKEARRLAKLALPLQERVLSGIGSRQQMADLDELIILGNLADIAENEQYAVRCYVIAWLHPAATESTRSTLEEKIWKMRMTPPPRGWSGDFTQLKWVLVEALERAKEPGQVSTHGTGGWNIQVTPPDPSGPDGPVRIPGAGGAGQDDLTGGPAAPFDVSTPSQEWDLKGRIESLPDIMEKPSDPENFRLDRSALGP